MAQRFRLPIFALLALLLAPGWTIELRHGSTLTIPAGTTINDDVLVSGGTVRVDGAIQGDLVLAGGNVQVNGAVGRDLIIAGGNVLVSGPVSGSVYAAGGTVDLHGTIDRNLVVCGGNITAGPDSTVGRDAVMNGGQLVLAGKVTRNVLVSAGNLAVESTARIGGNLTGQAPSPKIDPGAVIGGATNLAEAPSPGAPRRGFVAQIIWRLLTVLGMLFIGLVTIAAAPRFTREAVSMVSEHPWGTLLSGLVALLLTPIAIVILFIVPPLAVLLLLIYLAALLVAPIFAVARIGGWMWQRTGSLYPMLLLGLLVYLLLRLIPILSGLAGFLALLFGLGTLLLTLQARTASPFFHRLEPPGPVAMSGEGEGET